VVAGVVGRHILAWSHEQNRAVQVMLTGATTSVGPRWAYQWFEPLRTYSHARIAFMAQSPTSVPGAILLARTFPNAFLMSSWSELHVPTVIERDLAIMIQSVPMTKIVGFASGASSIEWVYARLQLAKKAMAGALAGPVDHRYYEEDEIPTILKQILLDTPKELFGISAG
jgi:glucuronate isomerase